MRILLMILLVVGNMATTSQLRSWWADYRCDASKYVKVAFPGEGREWWLLVAAPTVPAWEKFIEVMDKYDYKFREPAGGTYNCRPIGGTRRWSTHAYGIALDINPKANPYGPSGDDYPDGFVEEIESFEIDGEPVFAWGGRWSNDDDMHWQINLPPNADFHKLSTNKEDDEVSLSRGDDGHAVKKFQQALLKWNSNALPQYGADGDFGSETEAWVKKYQRAAHIDQTGRIDGVTAALLLEYLSPGQGTVDTVARARGEQALKGVANLRNVFDKIKGVL